MSKALSMPWQQAMSDSRHDHVSDPISEPECDPNYTNNPKVMVKDSPIHGRGVFARVDIPAFTYIGRYEGTATDEDGMHVLWLYDDTLETWVGIDGDNEMRFLNHSDDPNAEWSDVDLYATRWIAKGEEITFDYGWGDEEDDAPTDEDHIDPLPGDPLQSVTATNTIKDDEAS